MPTWPEIAEFIKAVGVPAATLFLVIWRLEGRLAELVKAVQGSAAPATPAHLDAATEKIIKEVDHNTRGALAHFDLRRQ